MKNKIDELNMNIKLLTDEVKKQAKELKFELSSNINDNLYRLRKELDTIPFIDEFNRRKITYNIASLNNVIVDNGLTPDTVLVKQIVDLWNNLEQIKKLINDKNDIIIRCLSNVMDNRILQGVVISIQNENNLKMTKITKSKKELFDNYEIAKKNLIESVTIDDVYDTSKKLLEELFDSYLGLDINIDENKEKLTRS